MRLDLLHAEREMGKSIVRVARNEAIGEAESLLHTAIGDGRDECAFEQSKKPATAIWPLYYFRGISYERQNQWPPAEADFKHALDLYPDQPLVMNYLGYSWVDQGVHLDQAFPMLRRAVELRPTDGYIVDSLGWADYKLGHYDEAVKKLERAVDLKPGDPVIQDHLGDAYWQVGRKLEAHFQWNHARDLDPPA